MIDLTGKSVFVRTQEEYESVLRMAKMQGFEWARGNSLNPIEIPLPNMLNFYESKTVTYNGDKALCEASGIVEDEKKLKRAVNLIGAFLIGPSRTALSEQLLDSLKLLTDTVKSQLEEDE